MSDDHLKLLAWTSKVLAIVFSAAFPLLVFQAFRHRGFNGLAEAQVIAVAILCTVPNRWLVWFDVIFVLSLLVALFPLRAVIDISSWNGMGTREIAGVILALAFLFAPLPISLILSRIRLRRGQKFMYA